MTWSKPVNLIKSYIYIYIYIYNFTCFIVYYPKSVQTAKLCLTITKIWLILRWYMPIEFLKWITMCFIILILLLFNIGLYYGRQLSRLLWYIYKLRYRSGSMYIHILQIMNRLIKNVLFCMKFKTYMIYNSTIHISAKFNLI